MALVYDSNGETFFFAENACARIGFCPRAISNTCLENGEFDVIRLVAIYVTLK